MLEITLLGRFDLRSNGEPVDLASRPLRKLIAYLVLNAGHSIPRAKLAGTLWIDSSESTARKNLRHYLWLLRQAIGDEYLQITRTTLAFDQTANFQFDVSILKNGSIDGGSDALIEAVSVYEGELLPGFYDNWVQQHREQLQALFERKMQLLLDRLAAESRWLDLLTWAEHWIAHAHTPEPAYRFLMIGCAGMGDLAGVVVNYWRCKKALRELIGVEPSLETQTLFEELTKKEKSAEYSGPSPFPAAVPSPIQFRQIQTHDPELMNGLNMVLTDLSRGNDSAIDWLAEQTRNLPEAENVARTGWLNWFKVVRSVVSQQSFTNGTTERLLHILDEIIDEKSIHLPKYLQEDSPAPIRPVFVGRQSILTRLDGLLTDVQNRQGSVAFVTGDIGSGKTSLLRAFAAQLSDNHPSFVVSSGTCSAYNGAGDPFSPFRRILNTLVGDTEQPWSAGTITTPQARNIWEMLPSTTEILLDYGSELLDMLIPRRPLLSRLRLVLPHSGKLADRLENYRADQPSIIMPERMQLFEQVTAMLRQLTRIQPLIILLDDFQWADTGSIDLLFHLCRNLSGARLLVLVAYRSDEINSQSDHPLRPLLAELRRYHGEVWFDLDQFSGREFVDEFVDSEPNRLDHEFRDSLFRNTAGHPLFTVELLHNMQQKGELVKDDSGVWIVKPSLDWRAMPARVDGAIESRLNHLDKELHQILSVAAVEGDVFTVQVAARVHEIPVSNLERALFEDLHKKFRLVQELNTGQFGDQSITRYRFAHQMFQRYLYDRLPEAERQRLHGQVGMALEELDNNENEELVIQLARHFDEAGISAKAVKYLLAAGDRARSLFSGPAAVQYYKQALEHLHLLNDDERLARTWMRLGLTYHDAFDYKRSLEAYNRAFEYWHRFSPPAQGAAGEVTFRLWQVEPLALDPTYPIDDDTGIWLIQLFSGLVRLNDEKVVVPDVAQRWEIRDDGRTYIFHLRQDLRWSDGEPLTADNFVQAWKRRLAPAPQDLNADRLFDIKGAQSFHEGRLVDERQLGLRAPDDSTLIIELERPTSYFLYLLATPYLFPIPKHTVEKFGDDWARPEHLVTNGPYQIIEWSDNGQVLLGRNPYYHANFSGNVSQVEISLLKEDDAWQESIDQYTQNQIDFLDATWFPNSIVREAKRRYGEFFTTLQPRPTTFSIHFNDMQSTLGNVQVRRALALAIDQEQLVSDLQKENAIPALGGYLPPGLPGHEPDIGIPFDPHAAQRLLAEAGYPDGKGFPELEMAWFDFPDMRDTATYIYLIWHERLGITIRPQFLSLPEMIGLFTGGTPPAINGGGWSADYHDPDCFLRLGMRFPLRHQRPILDKLEAARTMIHQDQRLALYRELDKVIVKDAITIPLHYSWFTVLFGARVRKVSPDFRWCDFILDPD